MKHPININSSGNVYNSNNSGVNILFGNASSVKKALEVLCKYAALLEEQSKKENK